MKEIIKRILHHLFRDYQFNRIYYKDVSDPQLLLSDVLPDGAVIRLIESSDQLVSSPDQRIREHTWYAGEYAHGYGIWKHDELLCICWFWTSGHPGMVGKFSALGDKEAVMVDLLTADQSRGRNYAAAIIRYAERDLLCRGYRRLWTWVWHSNIPSIRVFSKAEWIYSYFLAEFQLFGMNRYFRFRFPPIGESKA